MMEKDFANAFFRVEATDSAKIVDLRKRQILSFLRCDTEDSQPIISLAGAVLQIVESAALALEVSPPQSVSEVLAVNAADKSDTKYDINTFIFPFSLDKAGMPLSDNWWRAYERVTLIGLAVTGMLLYCAPSMLWVVQSMRLSIISKSEPPPVKPNPQNNESPFGDPKPPPGESTIPTEPVAVTDSNDKDNSLNPPANPNPAVFAPELSPTTFVYGLLTALAEGRSIQSFLKQPPAESVTKSLAATRRYCPRFYELQPDAIKVINVGDGRAIVRVNERYFTGENFTNDYYLESDNGAWKLFDIRPVCEAPQ